MKRLLNKSLVIALCGACLAVPLTVAANESVLKQKDLYEIRTLSGQFKPGILDGNLIEAKYTTPSAILELMDGKLLVSDTENHILRLIDGSSVSSYSGNILDFDTQGFAVGAYNDGNKENAFFDSPIGITQDLQGNIYVADSKNHAIRKVAADGTVTTIGGNGIQGNKDGVGKESQFNLPSDVVVDAKGNVYVADTLNHMIRKIDSNGKVTTLNKPSTRIVEYYSGAIVDTGEYKDGTLTEALFNEPSSLAIDGKGNLYVSDTGNQRIRYIDFTSNTVSTVAGGGELSSEALYVATGYKDGIALDARFANPVGINLASDGTLLIADSNNHVIRILANGKVTTLAGQPKLEGKYDGVLSAAQFDQPTDVLERKDGSIVVADASNNKVRVIQRYLAEKHTEDGQIHVLINSKLLESDVTTQIVEGRTYVPIRALCEGLGYTVKSNVATHTYSIIVNENLEFVFSNNGASVIKVTPDGEEKLGEASLLYNDRLLVPVRFVSEQLGFDVQWDGTAKHVVVRSKVFE